MRTPASWLLSVFARATQDLLFTAAAVTTVDAAGRVWAQNPSSIALHGTLAETRTPGWD